MRVVGDPRWRIGVSYDQLSALASRYPHPGNLTAFEFKVFSQNGEDGVIAELTRRLGSDLAPSFVEFGAGNGRAGNCLFLADVLGWQGLFIEPARDDYAAISRKYEYSKRVRCSNSFVTPITIDDLVSAARLGDIGVMSIDVDGNDFYIWQAMTERPQIIVIEYNGALPLTIEAVQPYLDRQWDGSSYFGASLEALVQLGKRKGYRLVHTDLTGLNAFFVLNEFAERFDDIVEVPRRPANYELIGLTHPADRLDRKYLRPTDP